MPSSTDQRYKQGSGSYFSGCNVVYAEPLQRLDDIALPVLLTLGSVQIRFEELLAGSFIWDIREFRNNSNGAVDQLLVRGKDLDHPV